MDKVQVSGAGSTTFAVCLDQDEKKILQTVTRCGVKITAHSHRGIDLDIHGVWQDVVHHQPFYLYSKTNGSVK